MKKINLLVVACNPDLPLFAKLNKFSEQVSITVTDDLKAVEDTLPQTEIVLFCRWKGYQDELKFILNACPQLKWVHTWWTGVDGLIYPELKQFPLVLTNARGAYAEPLAEFVVGACVYFAKDIPRLNAQKKARLWKQFENELIQGKVLGVFGYGEIGRSAARKAHQLGMKVIATRKRPQLSSGDSVVSKFIPTNNLPELFSQSDYLVCSAPLTDETKGIVNGQLLGLMKPTAVIINVGRGPVVNENSLIDALKQKTIRGAALDVFENEPLDPSSPLWDLDNVLLSPHSSDQCEGWLEHSMEMYLENLERYLKGEELKYQVNIELGY